MLNKNDEIKINKAIDGIIIEISERLPKEDKELKIAFEETEQITYGIVKNRINNLLSDLELYLQTEALKKEIFSTSENQVIFYKKNLFKKVKEVFGMGSEYGIYSFRHTFITKLYRELRKTLTPHETKSQLMLITGHTTFTALDKYLRDIDAELPADYSNLILQASR